MAGISLGAVLNQDKGAVARPAPLQQARPSAPARTVTLTENAARQARKLMEAQGDDPAKTWLRLAVQGGGCSGMSYHIDVARRMDQHDVEMEFHGVKVVVDKKSLLYLGGTQLDFGQGLQAGWKFINPNSKKACSCGESFAI
ncbi:MAG: iron-sulfur cluster assembly accessory protein [Deltaproteobacteria bacterium]|nr:iron-sulfur cluster assembly accessory protein [Deltaproteobacteria bacterium]